MLRINAKMEQHNKKVKAHKSKWKLRYNLLTHLPQNKIFQLFDSHTHSLHRPPKKRSYSARSLHLHVRLKQKPPRPKTCHSARNFFLKPQDFVFQQQRHISASLEKSHRPVKNYANTEQAEYFRKNYDEMLQTLQQFAAEEADYFTKNSFKPLVPKRRFQPKFALKKNHFPEPPLAKHVHEFNYQGLTLHHASQLPKWFFNTFTLTPCQYPQNLLSSKVLHDVRWHFRQECDLILLDKESLKFYQIRNIRCRAGKLVVWLQDQPAVNLDLLDLYTKINHILFFEKEGVSSSFSYCCLGNSQRLQFQMFLYQGRENRPLHKSLLAEFFEKMTLMRLGCEMPRRESAQLSLSDQRILKNISRRLLKKKRVLLLNQLGHAQQFELSDVLQN